MMFPFLLVLAGIPPFTCFFPPCVHFFFPKGDPSPSRLNLLGCSAGLDGLRFSGLNKSLRDRITPLLRDHHR